ncbi:MAG: hypothetical protein ACR2J0_08180 [Mycobacteriales bacterium]
MTAIYKSALARQRAWMSRHLGTRPPERECTSRGHRTFRPGSRADTAAR